MMPLARPAAVTDQKMPCSENARCLPAPPRPIVLPPLLGSGGGLFVTEHPAAHVHAPQPLSRPRILVVDDNKATAKALAALLASAGYDAAICYRGADAIDAAANGPFAAAFVDIHLPDIHGLVVSQKLRERWGHQVPILILSGDTS